jgi:hypothetical protein
MKVRQILALPLVAILADSLGRTFGMKKVGQQSA